MPLADVRTAPGAGNGGGGTVDPQAGDEGSAGSQNPLEEQTAADQETGNNSGNPSLHLVVRINAVPPTAPARPVIFLAPPGGGFELQTAEAFPGKPATFIRDSVPANLPIPTPAGVTPAIAFVQPQLAGPPSVPLAVVDLAERIEHAAAELPQRLADAVRAEGLPNPLPRHPVYHFAQVNAAATLCDSLGRFINECAALTPSAISPAPMGRHWRAWSVTITVAAADLAVAAYVLRGVRRQKACAGSPLPGYGE